MNFVRQTLHSLAHPVGKLLVRMRRIRLVGRDPSEAPRFIPVCHILSATGSLSGKRFGWSGDQIRPTFRKLLAGERYSISFVALGDFIVSFDLVVGTFGRINSCSIKAALFEVSPSGARIAERAHFETSCTDLVDNGSLTIPLGVPVPEPGQRYEIEIWSPDGVSWDSVALWGSDEIQRENLANWINYSNSIADIVNFSNAHRKEIFLPRFKAIASDRYGESILTGENLQMEPRFFKILPGLPLEFYLRSELADLDAIVIALCTYGIQVNVTVEFTISRISQSTRTTITQLKIPGTSIQSNEYYRIPLEQDLNSMGEWFEVKVASFDSTPDNCIAVIGAVSDSESELARRLEVHPEIGVSSCVLSKNHRFVSQRSSEATHIFPVASSSTNADGEILIITSDEGEGTLGLQFSKLLSEFRSTVVKSQNIAAIEVFKRFTFCFLYEPIWTLEVESFVTLLKREGVPVGLLSSGSEVSTETEPRVIRECILSDQPAGSFPFASPHEKLHAIVDFEFGRPRRGEIVDPKAIEVNYSDPSAIELAFEEAASRYAQSRQPSLSLVVVLSNSEEVIEHLLHSIFLQDYPGSVEVCLVDDASSDNALSIVEEFARRHPQVFGASGSRPINILKTERRLGICAARHLGISSAKGEIIILLDAACVLNPRFLSAHARAFSIGDADVVIGAMDLPTDGKDPLADAARYEENLSDVLIDSNLRDSTNLDSFLNCVTKNFAIRRAFITEPLFDNEFSSVNNLDSKFAWEDLEMGYRLFCRGSRIKFIEDAFTLRLPSHNSFEEEVKPLQALFKFRRLIEKHPGIVRDARSWMVGALRHLTSLIEVRRLEGGEDLRFVKERLKKAAEVRPTFSAERRLRVLTYRWHCPHQYEIYKLPIDVTLARMRPGHFTTGWDYDQRPLRENVAFKWVHEIDVRDYDLAILHFDENVLRPENTNGVIPLDWAHMFRWLREGNGLPKIAVCHGTPQFRGQYNTPCADAEVGKVLDFEREELVRYLADIPVICNSKQAESEWGFINSRTIWQGFDPTEFRLGKRESGVLSLGKPIIERPVYRGLSVYREVLSRLSEEISFYFLRVGRPAMDYHFGTNEYARAKFRKFIEEIGRYLIYFNPTLRSPMPRSRGEAMMCGLATVTTKNHDAALFIKNGVNGFCSDDPSELAEFIAHLLKNPNEAREIGTRGRETAEDLFNVGRFHSDWHGLMEEILGAQL